MALTEEFQTQGEWLFRWRSYLPLVLLGLIGLAFQQSDGHFEGGYHDYWEFICLGTSFLGLFVRVITVGHAPERTSGRNTKRQIADVLNTTGMY